MATTVPEVWSDLSGDLVHDAQGSVKKVINAEAVKTSINNILNTRKGERVMVPEFGVDFDEALFEPIDQDTMNFLADSVKETVERWDDRVKIVKVEFTAKPDSNQINLVVTYRITGNDNIFQVRRELGG
jgi:uncharacterized protein